MEDVRRITSANGGTHYVYLLCRPATAETPLTPFYVGIGQGSRIFSHEAQARDPSISNAKVEAIREVWRAGHEIVRLIESVHVTEPWDREERLINEIGRVVNGSGPLTNAQAYSRSVKVDGVELRKYAADAIRAGAIPKTFRLRNVRLMAGPRKPRSQKSVFGKIFAVAEANPGVTGEELVMLLQTVDFTDNKSAYTQGGQVCASWLAGYIEGAFSRSDRLHLQAYSGSLAE